MSSGKRGPYAKTQVRKEQIADATLALMAERGDAKVSAAEIAARAGLSEATVVYHFPTKDDLYVNALARDDEVSGRGYTVDLDLEDIIRAGTVHGVENRGRVQMYATMTAAGADPAHPGHAFALQHHRGSADMFANLLRQRQAQGLAHPDVDPEKFGRQMVAVWDGLQLQWLVDPTIDLVEEVTAAFRTLTRQDAMEAKRALEAIAAEL